MASIGLAAASGFVLSTSEMDTSLPGSVMPSMNGPMVRSTTEEDLLQDDDSEED